MRQVTRARAIRLAVAALPAVAIAAVVAADLAVGQSIVLGLVVVAPLLAANVVGPRLTLRRTALDAPFATLTPAHPLAPRFAVFASRILGFSLLTLSTLPYPEAGRDTR